MLMIFTVDGFAGWGLLVGADRQSSRRQHGDHDPAGGTGIVEVRRAAVVSVA